MSDDKKLDEKKIYQRKRGKQNTVQLCQLVQCEHFLKAKFEILCRPCRVEESERWKQSFIHSKPLQKNFELLPWNDYSRPNSNKSFTLLTARVHKMCKRRAKRKGSVSKHECCSPIWTTAIFFFFFCIPASPLSMLRLRGSVLHWKWDSNLQAEVTHNTPRHSSQIRINSRSQMSPFYLFSALLSPDPGFPNEKKKGKNWDCCPAPKIQRKGKVEEGHITVKCSIDT